MIIKTNQIPAVGNRLPKVLLEKSSLNINGLTKQDSHTNADTRMTIISLSVPLMLIMINYSRQNIFFSFFLFSEKIELDISCVMSA